MRKTDISDIQNKINFANGVVLEMQKSGNFNPFDALQGTENKQQKLYSFCVQFLYELENASDIFNENLKKCL